MNCNHCGAGLTQEDWHQPACKYCGTVFEHYARAAEKVAVVQGLLAPGPGGVPMALQGMMGMPPQAPMGMPPPPMGGPPVVVAQSAFVVGGGPAPPPMGGPMPAYHAPPLGVRGSGMATITIIIVIAAVGFVVALVVFAAAALFLVRV